MEIVQPTMAGEQPDRHARSRANSPGEITMISGQRCLVRGRVTEAGEFLETQSGGAALAGREGRRAQRNL